jgi:repressor LexA
MELSERQQRILRFIEKFREENGYPPTVRQIGQEVGISSTSVVDYHLRALQEKGCIQRDRKVSRGLSLPTSKTLRTRGIVSVPIAGVIAAGHPIPVPDSDFSTNEMLTLTRDILGNPEGLYALRVKGNSMIDALVHDGDIVVMRHQKQAENGEMVAVWLKDKGETTLKRFYREKGQVRLQPANPTMKPIFVHPKDVEIQGRVILVIRQS